MALMANDTRIEPSFVINLMLIGKEKRAIREA
jgi:hypothetical protein